MIWRALAAGLVALAVTAAPAAAHIQVRPTLVAPGDPVLFQLIVPNEKDAHTVEVTLQVPKDVLPFSFEEPAGWKRTNQLAADQSIETVTWKGKLEQDGFAQFSFLASTPDTEGDITWKAIQKYDDGSTVRWIGDARLGQPRRGDQGQQGRPEAERGRRRRGGVRPGGERHRDRGGGNHRRGRHVRRTTTTATRRCR